MLHFTTKRGYYRGYMSRENARVSDYINELYQLRAFFLLNAETMKSLGHFSRIRAVVGSLVVTTLDACNMHSCVRNSNYLRLLRDTRGEGRGEGEVKLPFQTLVCLGV